MILLIHITTFDRTTKLNEYAYKERKKIRRNNNPHINKSLRQAIVKLNN